jgi:hypothetical protein
MHYVAIRRAKNDALRVNYAKRFVQHRYEFRIDLYFDKNVSFFRQLRSKPKRVLMAVDEQHDTISIWPSVSIVGCVKKRVLSMQLLRFVMVLLLLWFISQVEFADCFIQITGWDMNEEWAVCFPSSVFVCYLTKLWTGHLHCASYSNHKNNKFCKLFLHQWHWWVAGYHIRLSSWVCDDCGKSLTWSIG